MRLRAILVFAATAGVVAAGERFVLENSAVGRALSTEGGTLRTVGLLNKRAGLAVEPIYLDRPSGLVYLLRLRRDFAKKRKPPLIASRRA